MSENFELILLVLFGSFFATCLLMWFEHVLYISKPGTSIYQKGFPVRRITVPVLEKEHWLSFLADGEFIEGVFDVKKGEVYVRGPKGRIRWFYNPFIGQIKLSKPDILIVRFAPATAINWFIWLVIVFYLTLLHGDSGQGLIAFILAVSFWITLVYGHYWFFASNAVATIKTSVRRRKKG